MRDKLWERLALWLGITLASVGAYLWTTLQARVEAYGASQNVQEVQLKAHEVELNSIKAVLIGVDRKVDKLLDMHMGPNPK